MIATDDGVDGITGGAGGDEDGGGNIGSKIFERMHQIIVSQAAS